jgi:hypothetical protein
VFVALTVIISVPPVPGSSGTSIWEKIQKFTTQYFARKKYKSSQLNTLLEGKQVNMCH